VKNNKIIFGNKLRDKLLNLWDNDIYELKSIFQLQDLNNIIMDIRDIKILIEDAFREDELLIDRVDNIINSAKIEIMALILEKMNIEFPNVQNLIDTHF
jgi:hypothetical protein